MSRDTRWTEADVIAYMQRQGMMLTPALTLPQDMPEGTLLAKIRQLAKEQSFLVYHTHNSQRSESGFLDLVLTKPGRLIFAEVKRQRGKLTPEQFVWLDVLRHSIAKVEVYEWKPSDWPHIVEILTRKENPA